MIRNHALTAALLLFSGLAVVGCGGGSSRVLTAISISPNPAKAKNGTVQLVATGTFSSAPVTVTPLTVDWSQSPCNDLCNSTPEVIGPISVSSTGLATCPATFTGTTTVWATAPKDPSLAPGTRNVPTVTGTASLTCP